MSRVTSTRSFQNTPRFPGGAVSEKGAQGRGWLQMEGLLPHTGGSFSRGALASLAGFGSLGVVGVVFFDFPNFLFRLEGFTFIFQGFPFIF